MRVRTTDLYYGAYLMSRGVALREIRLEESRKRRAVFEFSSADPEAGRLEREYLDGVAVANVRDLKLSLDRLKDLMFERMRNLSSHT